VCTAAGSISPGLDELLDLGDRHPPGRGAQRVEVLRALVVDEVAVPVADAACTRAKSVRMARSSTYGVPSNSRTSFGGRGQGDAAAPS
jgi:hypothetical protein